MNRLRTHIARLTTVFLVGLGFSLYLVQPSQAKKSTKSFASWFSKMTKTVDSADLQDELNSLQSSGDHLENVIKEASQIVSRNNDDFQFSFSESMASDNLYQLLLIEWSQFQTENAMASVPVQHISKLVLPATIDKLGGSEFLSSSSSSLDLFSALSGFTPAVDAVISITLTPMADGIAIGAP